MPLSNLNLRSDRRGGHFPLPSPLAVVVVVVGQIRTYLSRYNLLHNFRDNLLTIIAQMLSHTEFHGLLTHLTRHFMEL